MRKSHAAGEEKRLLEKERPTPAQLKELFDQIDKGRVNRYRLQELLNAPTPGPRKFVSETGIWPGMVLRYYLDCRTIKFFTPDGEGMQFHEHGDKILAPCLPSQFLSMCRFLADTHGLKVKKVNQLPHLVGVYEEWEFCLPNSLPNVGI